MATILNRTTTFATNGTVTAAGLHNLIDDTAIYAGLITTQTELTTVGTADQILIAVGGVSDTGTPRRATVQNLFDDALTGGTYSEIHTSGSLTYGTATGTRLVSTNATITTGTIATLNSTTGTIANLSTTLAGDFTISQGTGTLGTSGVTLGTYGSVTAIPFLTVNAKGIITAATTGTFSTTPADGSITFAKLSTSATEADNVASRTAKAWVNFNGTGTVGTRASLNVSSITDNATGDYTVNFTIAIQDANYAAMITGDSSGARVNTYGRVANLAAAPTANALRIIFCDDQSTAVDTEYANVSIFR